MNTTKQDRATKACYRELGIRAVVRNLLAGRSVEAYHASTVKAAARRMADPAWLAAYESATTRLHA